MKIKFRMLCMLLCAVILLGIPMRAKADVIHIPDNDFFMDNMDICQSVERRYTVSGPNGGATVYESPVDDREVSRLENGEEIYISHLFLDERGIGWGLYEDWQSDVIGWIPMNYLTVVYDITSFLEDHGDRVEEKNGAFSELYHDSMARFHSYPGSPDYEEAAVSDWNAGKGAETYSKVYVDNSGRKWVMVDRYYAALNDAWVDVTTGQMPDNQTVPAETEPTPLPPIHDHTEEIKPQKDFGPTVALVLWTVALVLVTWLLLLVLKRKK